MALLLPLLHVAPSFGIGHCRVNVPHRHRLLLPVFALLLLFLCNWVLSILGHLVPFFRHHQFPSSNCPILSQCNTIYGPNGSSGPGECPFARPFSASTYVIYNMSNKQYSFLIL